MRIKVVFFGSLTESVMADPREMTLDSGSTVEYLRQTLCSEFPLAAAVLEHAMVALDAEYATDSAVIGDGAEVAFLPPVSGG